MLSQNSPGGTDGKTLDREEKQLRGIPIDTHGSNS
jgi:hypothetical protein